jgi:hypothetical protein
MEAGHCRHPNPAGCALPQGIGREPRLSPFWDGRASPSSPDSPASPAYATCTTRWAPSVSTFCLPSVGAAGVLSREWHSVAQHGECSCGPRPVCPVFPCRLSSLPFLCVRCCAAAARGRFLPVKARLRGQKPLRAPPPFSEAAGMRTLDVHIPDATYCRIRLCHGHTCASRERHRGAERRPTAPFP